MLDTIQGLSSFRNWGGGESIGKVAYPAHQVERGEYTTEHARPTKDTVKWSDELEEDGIEEERRHERIRDYDDDDDYPDDSDRDPITRPGGTPGKPRPIDDGGTPAGSGESKPPQGPEELGTQSSSGRHDGANGSYDPKPPKESDHSIAPKRGR